MDRYRPASMAELTGRTIAITGAARGIGLATAAACLKRGASVAIGDIDHDAALAAADQLRNGAVMAEVAAYPLDVTDRESFAAFLDATERDLGQLSVLVNNAGIMPIQTFATQDYELARRVFDINVHGVIIGTKLALERMLPRGEGHIVNVASAAGKMAAAGVATYCSSKFAVAGLCEALQGELRGSGVDLTCVLPGVVNTDLAAGLGGPSFLRIEPEDVAEAITHALKHPRAEVFVPRLGGAMIGAVSMLPLRARRALLRLGGLEQITTNAEHSNERAAYEKRARQRK